MMCKCLGHLCKVALGTRAMPVSFSGAQVGLAPPWLRLYLIITTGEQEGETDKGEEVKNNPGGSPDDLALCNFDLQTAQPGGHLGLRRL